jgi:HPr kinase/phosphorylase
MTQASARTVTVEELLREKSQYLQLELLTEGCDLRRPIGSATISSPGLVLAGYSDRYPRGRLQVLGETEIGYLRSLEVEERRTALERFLQLPLSAVVVTKNQQIPVPTLEVARTYGVPLLRSRLKTGEFYRRIQPWLDQCFAPQATMHGSMADVYGVGLLFVGRSGIGKSECVLDLVERGHRLVADDLVVVTRHGNDVLIGRGADHHEHHMEIRGVGLINIKRLFGIRAIRQQKRIEVVVQLVEWDDREAYERTGLAAESVDILGVALPTVTVPLNAGKNITVISEVVAMNLLLRYSGYDTAQEFNEQLIERMRDGGNGPQEKLRNLREYLEQDYE